MLESTKDRIMKIQHETLGSLLGFTGKVEFDIAELKKIADAQINKIIVIRLTSVKVSPSAKALAGVLIEKNTRK